MVSRRTAKAVTSASRPGDGSCASCERNDAHADREDQAEGDFEDAFQVKEGELRGPEARW